MKKFIFLALSLVLCSFAINIYAQDHQTYYANEQNQDIFYHTVERGQTVYSIATMYGVKVEDIYKLNIGSGKSIKAGDKLKIPQKRVSNIQSGKEEKAYIFHTIQSGETLYGVSKIYDVSGEKIIEYNPGLSQKTFSAGKTIRIPTNISRKQTVVVVKNKKGAKEIYYTVPIGETLYNICKKFKTSEKEINKLNPELAGGLRTGMTLRFPLRINEKEILAITENEENEFEVNEMLKNHPASMPVNAAKVALLLPYDSKTKSSTVSRMVEYYEGMLLAVDSLRRKGQSAEIFVYDIGEGTDKTQNILKNKASELENVNMIIGGLSNDQIKLIANFAQKNKVKYVIPFTSKNDEIHNNAYIFQINTPHQHLYANAAYAGANLFAKYNIIFLDTKDKDAQTDFVKEFKKELESRNITCKNAVYSEKNFSSSIKTVLTPDKPNVIIPISSSLEALTKIKTVLRSIAEKQPNYKLTLFGYPVWQTYSKECLDDFHALNTYIYSLFYADNMSPSVKTFYNNYKNWFSKSPTMSTFPKYAMLGFDTGMYFFNAINSYGSNFESYLSDIHYKSVQTGFNFERVNNWGGFINTNIYIIHYNKDYTITRSDFK